MKLSELIDKYGDCEVSEELLGMIETKGDWEPEFGGNYYFISEVLQAGLARNKGDDYAYARIMKRNVYQTKEEAQFALDMYNFCKERSFEPDWKKDNSKWIVNLSNLDGKAYIIDCIYHNYFCPFYYESKEVAQEVIDKYSFEELAKYYGRV